MPDFFTDLREDLLRAGIAPARVVRYLAELRDHRADIAEHLEAMGMAPETAQREADLRLGTHDALLLPMLTDRRFRSLAARAPALFYLAAPLAAMAALAFCSVLVLGFAAQTALRPNLIDLASLLAILWLIAPICAGWIAIGAARRRCAPLHWPIAASVVLSTGAAALNLGVVMPQPGVAGEISLGLTLPTPVLVLALLALSMLPACSRSFMRWMP